MARVEIAFKEARYFAAFCIALIEAKVSFESRYRVVRVEAESLEGLSHYQQKNFRSLQHTQRLVIKVLDT